MRNIILTAVLILTSFVAGSQNATTSEPKRQSYVYIQGHFFKDTPKELIGKSKSMARVEYKDITIWLNVYNDSSALSDDIFAQAIPLNQLEDGEAILKEARSREKLMELLSFKRMMPIHEGDRFPEFTAMDIDGIECSNKDLEGKVTVLNLWTSTCGPCRAEMPELSTWKELYPDVVFLSATYEDADKARPVVEKLGFTWRHLVNDTLFLRWNNGKGFPMTIVVDRKGIIRRAVNGTNPGIRADILATIAECVEE